MTDITIPKKKPLSKTISVRISKAEYTYLQAMADMFAEGDKSVFIRYVLHNFKPAMIGHHRRKKRKKGKKEIS